MTMMIDIAVRAPITPKIHIELGFFAKMAKFIAQAHRQSRETQNLMNAHDAILKDIGLSRLKVNGNACLFSHLN